MNSSTEVLSYSFECCAGISLDNRLWGVHKLLTGWILQVCPCGLSVSSLSFYLSILGLIKSRMRSSVYYSGRLPLDVGCQDSCDHDWIV